jgi:hypothetical protein
MARINELDREKTQIYYKLEATAPASDDKRGIL